MGIINICCSLDAISDNCALCMESSNMNTQMSGPEFPVLKEISLITVHSLYWAACIFYPPLSGDTLLKCSCNLELPVNLVLGASWKMKKFQPLWQKKRWRELALRYLMLNKEGALSIKVPVVTEYHYNIKKDLKLWRCLVWIHRRAKGIGLCHTAAALQ